MIDAITGALSGLKTAAEITQALLALKTDAIVSAKVSELNRAIFDLTGKLLSVQVEQSAQLRRVRDLEAQIAEFKHWEKEKKRYELKELVPGTLVYRVKPVAQKGEPVHDLCPHCYQQGVKSILQYSGRTKSHHSKSRPHCHASFLLDPRKMFFTG
jgi:hypothetical protein